MFVYLVVVDPGAWLEERWPICCTNSIFIHLSDGVVGDDTIPDPTPDYGDAENPEQLNEMMIKEVADHPETFHFPNTDKSDDVYQYYSRDYLTAILLGTTGWSGWSDEKGHWKCTFDDLSDAGQTIYALIQGLYGDKGNLHLVTYLDT
jgi:uncharacterized protein CbrC (UPF0167 family)